MRPVTKRGATMAMVNNAINWFEIPVSDIERAAKFYSKVLAADMPTSDFSGTKMAFFLCDRDGVHGALVQGEGYVPSEKGAVVYLNGGEDLAPALARVKAAGGAIIRDKFAIGEHGFVAFFKDTEGN